MMKQCDFFSWWNPQTFGLRSPIRSDQVRFMVDGERIAADDTAEKLGLEASDVFRFRRWGWVKPSNMGLYGMVFGIMGMNY